MDHPRFAPQRQAHPQEDKGCAAEDLEGHQKWHGGYAGRKAIVASSQKWSVSLYASHTRKKMVDKKYK